MRLADQAAILVVGRLSQRVVGLLSGVILVRTIAPYDYGTFLQISLIAALLASSLLLGLPQSLMYFLPGSARDRRRSFVLQTIALVGGISLIAAALIGAATPWLARLLRNPGLGRVGLIVAAYAALAAIDHLVEPTLIALGQARRAGILAIVFALALLAATVLPARAGWSVEGIYACIAVVYAGRLAYYAAIVLRLRDSVVAARPLERGWVARQMRFALPLGLAGMTGQYSRQIDGLVVSFMFTPAAYAVYSRGAFELPLIDLFPYTLAAVLLPRLVELWSAGRVTDLAALWNRSLQVSSLLIFPAFSYAFLFADELIVTLFTDAYRESIPVFRIYLLALPFRLTSYGTILQAVGNTASILRSSLLGIAVSVVLAMTLCPFFGPRGAAAGYVVAQLGQITYLLVVIRRRTGIPWLRMLPWSWLALVGGTAVAAGISTHLLTAPIQEPLTRLAVSAPLFGALILAGFAGTRRIGAAEIAMLKRWGVAVMSSRRSPGASSERVVEAAGNPDTSGPA